MKHLTITDENIRKLLFDPRVTVRVANDCRRALGWIYPGAIDNEARARCAVVLNGLTG
jgi:hypothetical protein